VIGLWDSEPNGKLVLSSGPEQGPTYPTSTSASRRAHPALALRYQSLLTPVVWS